APLTVGGAQVNGTVFRDWNGNGTPGSGEEAISGLTVTLETGGNSVATATTDANGAYIFAGVAAGNYSVRAATPAGHTLSTSSNPVTLTLASNQIASGIIFGFKPTGSATLGGKVLDDANRSAAQNGGEAGIDGAAVSLYEDTNGDGKIDAGDALVATTTTSSGGGLSFGSLNPGFRYLVMVGDGIGSAVDTYFTNPYSVTTANPRAVIPTDFSGSSNNYQGANFGYFGLLPATISGAVFNDANRNGAYNAATDTPLPGVTVYLYAGDGTTLVSTTSSGSDGAYRFSGLPPATYVVKVDTSDTDIPAQLVAYVTQHSAVTVVAGQTDSTRGFPFVAVVGKSGPATGNPGDTLAYTIAVASEGNESVSSAVVKDTLPAGTTFVSAGQGGRPETYLNDSFEEAVYDANDGSENWASSWTETNDDNSPTAGNISIEGGLSFKTVNNQTQALTRRANLTGATYAKLTVVIATNGMNNANQKVVLEASKDAGNTWVQLGNYTIGTAAGAVTYDLVALLSGVTATTDIRVRNNGTANGGPIITFSSVEIDYATPTTPVIWNLGATVGPEPSTVVAGATTTDLTPTADTYVESGNNAGNSYGTAPTVKVRTTSRFGLLQWDLTSLPAGAIQSAQLLLYQESTRAGTVDFYKTTSAWTETTTYNSRPTHDASASLAALSATTVVGQRSSTATSSLKNLVTGWKDGSVANHGLWLKSTADTKFSSRSAATAANRPILRVVTGGTGSYTNTLTPSRSLAKSGDVVTVTMVVANNTGSAVTGVAPPANLTVNNLEGFGATATRTTGPSPAGPVTIAANSSATFTYTYTIGGAITAPDQLTFSGTPTSTSPSNAWGTAISGGVLIARDLTLTVKVNASTPPNALSNTASLETDIRTSPTNTVTTALTGSIGDLVFSDLNANGAFDAGEPGLPNVRVYIDQNGNRAYEIGEPFALTGSNGHYLMSGLTQATYNVRYDYSTVSAGYTPTTTSSLSVSLPYTNAQVLTADFGLRPPDTSSITGSVWVDVSREGVFDAAETAIPNVDVKLYADVNNDGAIDAGDVLLSTVATNASGVFQFTGLPGSADSV
ncbi:MAG: hypothetical protein RIQ93_3432, partial [Verrucomicrobiota bacterium]